MKSLTPELSPGELHELFGETEPGKHLAGELRFNHPYRCDTDGGNPVATPEEWYDRLGPDVNIYQHGLLMGRFGQAFARRSPELDEYEGLVLGFTGVAHDWSEHITKDVTHTDKTAQYEKDSLAAYEHILRDVIPREHQSLYVILRADVHAVLSDTEKETKLGRAFNAVERIGYLQTALHAWEWADEIADDRPEVAERLRWLTYDVLANNLTGLAVYASEFGAARKYLEDIAPRIPRCFREMPHDMSVHYSPEKGEMKRRQWQASQEWFAGAYRELVDEPATAA